MLALRENASCHAEVRDLSAFCNFLVTIGRITGGNLSTVHKNERCGFNFSKGLTLWGNSEQNFFTMRWTYVLLPCLGFLMGAGSMSDYPKPSPAELMARVPQKPVMHCKTHSGLPDKKCTPGKAWTTDKETICNGGSTSLIRPSDTYTNKLKVAQIREYGYGDVDPGDYEEDHLVPLEIGGHPDDPENLWPEAHAGKNGSQQKDKVEDWLHAQICRGAMTPQAAQDGMKTNWKQYLAHVTPYKPPAVQEVE
jgi:hypothetical protein